MPFIVGIHSSFLSEARNRVTQEDQIVFVMLDDGEVKLQGVSRSPVDSMPPAVVQRLHRRLTSLREQLQQDSAGSRVRNPVAGGVCVVYSAVDSSPLSYFKRVGADMCA